MSEAGLLLGFTMAFFFAFFSLQGFCEFGTPPLSAWTRTGAEAPRASPVTSTASFRVRNFTNYLRA